MILRRTEARAASRGAHRAAFTLMEVLVVAAIIVILASVASVGVLNYLDTAKEKAAVAGIQKLETAVGTYKVDHGDYPADLSLLILPEEGKPARLEEKDLRDPWQQPYIYEPNNRHPTVGKPHIYSTGGGAKVISNF